MPTSAKLGITAEFFTNGHLHFPAPGIELLKQYPHLEPHPLTNNLEITASQRADCDFIVTGATRWTKPALEGSDHLIALLMMGVGYDHIDVDALTEADVMLCAAPDAVRRPMATTIMTFLLVLATRLWQKDRITREGRWLEQKSYNGDGLEGRTFGSIGVGNIGREFFKLAMPFGMRHLACDPHVSAESVTQVGVELVDLETVLTESDYVSGSVPLSDTTYHMIGEAEFRKMRPDAYFINTARGRIVDEPALIRALNEGWIRGAGLDVFEQEPVDPENPLLKLDNVVVAPHSLCHTTEYLHLGWTGRVASADTISRGGIPEAVVNKAVLDKPSFRKKLARYGD